MSFSIRWILLVRRRILGVGFGMADTRFLDRVFCAGGAASCAAARALERVLFAGAVVGTAGARLGGGRRRLRFGFGGSQLGVATLGGGGVSSTLGGAWGNMDRVIRLLSSAIATLGIGVVVSIVFLGWFLFVMSGAVASTSWWSSLISCLAESFGIPLTTLAHSASAFMTLS